MTTQRKPMTFAMNADRRVPAQVPRAEGSERQQVGARVTKATYRQLKARAALQGGTVQALVEQAIDEFLAKHPD
jgi:predicted HicB family RNase H-like nuclease